MGLLSLAARAALESGDMFGRKMSRTEFMRAEALARAEAMGFDTSKVFYHGTKATDINSFRPSRAGGTDSFVGLADRTQRHSRGTYGPGVYVSSEPERTFGFAGMYDDVPSGGNILPVFVRRGKAKRTIGQDARVEDPRDIRSIFAAFDPARRDSSDILAGIGGGGLIAALVAERMRGHASA